MERGLAPDFQFFGGGDLEKNKVDVPSFRMDHTPYGGVKDSGLGREGVRAAIGHLTEERLLVVRDVPAG